MDVFISGLPCEILPPLSQKLPCFKSRKALLLPIAGRISRVCLSWGYGTGWGRRMLTIPPSCIGWEIMLAAPGCQRRIFKSQTPARTTSQSVIVSGVPNPLPSERAHPQRSPSEISQTSDLQCDVSHAFSPTARPNVPEHLEAGCRAARGKLMG